MRPPEADFSLMMNSCVSGRSCESDRKEALARLKEVLNLFKRVNSRGSRELSIFLPAGVNLDFAGPRGSCLSARIPTPTSESLVKVQRAFDRLASCFARSAGPELMADDYHNHVWRTTMFCRLLDINEEEMEEWSSKP